MTPYSSKGPKVPCLLSSGFLVIIGLLVFNPFAFGEGSTKEEHVAVVLKDFSVHLDATQTTAGELIFSAVNKGLSIHELVIVKTNLHSASLPRKPTKTHEGMDNQYQVDEHDSHIERIDEIEEFPPGTKRERSVALGPGLYVLLCNIPGHYDKGMHASFHVTH